MICDRCKTVYDKDAVGVVLRVTPALDLEYRQFICERCFGGFEEWVGVKKNEIPNTVV